jgi:4'-phosphopantetheinyl transferase
MNPRVPREFHPLPGLVIHALPLGQGQVLEDARALLDATEQARAAAYHQPADVARFITGRAALRRLIGIRLDLPPHTLRWVQGPHGKLALDPQQGIGLEFNLSHSGEWVLVALSDVGAVGVDVECIEHHRDLPAIAERVFSPRELEILRRRDKQGAVDFFYRTWTCKEAWIKTLGIGLGHPLEQLDLHEAALAPTEACTPVVDDTGSRDWRCWRLVLDHAHHAAVVLASPAGNMTQPLR